MTKFESSRLNVVAVIAKTYTHTNTHTHIHTYCRTKVIPKIFFFAVIDKGILGWESQGRQN